MPAQPAPGECRRKYKQVSHAVRRPESELIRGLLCLVNGAGGQTWANTHKRDLELLGGLPKQQQVILMWLIGELGEN